MKKIKGLLLFGILTLLGIGSSFGLFIDLRDNTGSQLLIPNYSRNNDGYPTADYYLGDSLYLSDVKTDVALNNAGLVKWWKCLGSDLSIKGFYSYGYFDGIFTTFGVYSGCSSSELFNDPYNSLGYDYVYIRNNLPISPYSERKEGSISRYLYFDDNYYYTYSGNVNDVPSGYTRQKLFLSLAGNYGITSSDSSGNYLFTSLFDDSFSISNPTIYSGFLLLHFGGYDTEYYNGNSTLLLSLGEDLVYYNYYTGFYIDYSAISQVSPTEKGVLTYNNSSSSGYSEFIDFLNNGYKIVLSDGSINNGLSLTSYGYQLHSASTIGGGYFTTTSNLVLNFESDDSIPTFVTSSGGSSQTGGIDVIPFSSIYYQCLGPSYNTPDGNPPAFCLNPDGTLIDIDDYKNCYFTLSASGDLMENMYCDNDGYVQEMAWVSDGSGGFYSACYGEDCGVMFVFGPNYLSSEDSFNLSTGLVLDMMTNLTGWVGRCPFPYTDFQLGKNSQFLQYLKTLGFKYDPFIFVNCVVAGFHHGRHIVDNTMFGDTFEHPLLYGDTSKHRSLFAFLDFVVILGLFGLFTFIKKMF